MKVDEKVAVSITSEATWKDKFLNVETCKSNTVQEIYTDEPLQVKKKMQVCVTYQG